MIDKYNSNEFNKAFVILLLYTIQNKQNVECRMFSREKSLQASHVKVIQIPITIKADLFRGIFEAIPGTL